jgi:hypothetical protein
MELWCKIAIDLEKRDALKLRSITLIMQSDLWEFFFTWLSSVHRLSRVIACIGLYDCI